MIYVLAAMGLAVSLLAYWLLVITEGTYLGPRVVTLLYDWTATKYDRVKNLHFVNEAYFLGHPLREGLRAYADPTLLDVATGTARLPLAVMAQDGSRGRFFGLDRSRRMMNEARTALSVCDGSVALVQGDVEALPFADERFHGVTCLEAIEFIRDPHRVLAEMARVLMPGGVLLVSNRIGRDARFFPGRMAGRGRLERALGALHLESIRTQRWQVHYDLVWARKPGGRVSGYVSERLSAGSGTTSVAARQGEETRS